MNKHTEFCFPVPFGHRVRSKAFPFGFIPAAVIHFINFFQKALHLFFRHTLFSTYILTVFYPDFLTAFICIIFDENVI